MPLTYRLSRHDFPMPFRQNDLEVLSVSSDSIRDQANQLSIFRGIFGLPTNALLTLSAFQSKPANVSLPGSTIAHTEDLTPTARPKTMAPLPDGGIIVLRWFQISEENSEEFVALSDEAWISMEASFDCQVIGLFQASEAPHGKNRLLLTTWYASHAEWERSRDARPQAGAAKAWQNFRRRHLLTDYTEASVVVQHPFD